jgi:hypothetical protein
VARDCGGHRVYGQSGSLAVKHGGRNTTSLKCPWPLYRRVEVVGRPLTVVGFVGLWLCKQMMQHMGMTERRWMETPAGSTSVWFLSGCFALGLLVLAPVSLYLQERAGVPRPGPGVPAWIAWPLIAVMILGFCLLLLLALAAALQCFAQK